LHIDHLEEITLLEPFSEPRTASLRQQGASVPIAVSCEDWQKWKKGEFK